MKKWRPFWSYSVEETEQWLTQMSTKGWALKSFNRMSVFRFEQAPPKQTKFLVDLRSDEARLTKANWTLIDRLGQWCVYEAEEAQLYPARDKLFSRIKTHYFGLLFALLLFIIPVLSAGSALIIDRAALLPIVFIGMYSALMALLFSLYRLYRKKEKHYLGIQNPTKNNIAIRKIRPSWMYKPYETKKWLEQQFEEGYELERGGNVFFYFIPKQSEQISYEITYEKSVKTSYFELHKELGWQLKFTSSSSILNTSIWAMPYGADEEKPMMTYEKEEKIQALKRGLKFTSLLSLLILFSMGINLVLVLMANGVSLFEQLSIQTVSFVSVCFVSLLWLYIWIRAIKGYFNEKKQLQQDGVL